MSSSTRQQFIAAAEALFAERGFYGVSIAAIADELGLTKQALLHHFGSKEKLYAEVLANISGRLMEVTRLIMSEAEDAGTQLEELVIAQYREQMSNPDSARLIMRELLDNEQRAAQAGNWFLKPYLESLVDTVHANKAPADLDRGAALALVYQLLGAAHYFAVSQPTLTMIFGAKTLGKARGCYEDELRTLIRSRLAS